VPNYQCKSEPHEEFPSGSNTKLSNDQKQKITSEPSSQKAIMPKTTFRKQIVENSKKITLIQPKQKAKLNLAAIRKIGVPEVASSPLFLTNSQQPQHNGQSAMQAGAWNPYDYHDDNIIKLLYPPFTFCEIFGPCIVILVGYLVVGNKSLA
jgi:hypothetical protein